MSRPCWFTMEAMEFYNTARSLRTLKNKTPCQVKALLVSASWVSDRGLWENHMLNYWSHRFDAYVWGIKQPCPVCQFSQTCSDWDGSFTDYASALKSGWNPAERIQPESEEIPTTVQLSAEPETERRWKFLSGLVLTKKMQLLLPFHLKDNSMPFLWIVGVIVCKKSIYESWQTFLADYGFMCLKSSSNNAWTFASTRERSAITDVIRSITTLS